MQQKYPLLIEIIARLKVKSPSLFARLQLILVTLAGIFEFCTLLKDVAHVNFADSIEQYINHGSAGVVVLMYFFTALPVEDKKELHEKVEQLQAPKSIENIKPK